MRAATAPASPVRSNWKRAIETDAERRLNVLEQARGIWADLHAPLGVARVDLASAEFSTASTRLPSPTPRRRTFERLGAKGAAARARQLAAAMMAGDHPRVVIRVVRWLCPVGATATTFRHRLGSPESLATC